MWILETLKLESWKEVVGGIIIGLLFFPAMTGLIFFVQFLAAALGR